MGRTHRPSRRCAVWGPEWVIWSELGQWPQRGDPPGCPLGSCWKAGRGKGEDHQTAAGRGLGAWRESSPGRVGSHRPSESVRGWPHGPATDGETAGAPRALPLYCSASYQSCTFGTDQRVQAASPGPVRWESVTANRGVRDRRRRLSTGPGKLKKTVKLNLTCRPFPSLLLLPLFLMLSP